jgi:hypothetical protein
MCPIQQPTFQPVLTVDIANSTDCKITHLPIVNAGEEYSLLLTNGLKQLRIKCQGSAVLKYSFTEGESLTNYFTIFKGTCDNLNDLDFNDKTLYIQSDKSSMVIEIMELY